PVRRLIATGLGTGLLPLAPGTWASAAACVVFLAVAWGCGGRGVCVNGWLIALAALACVGCVATGGYCETCFGSKDPRQCTVDEWAGQWVSLLFVPLGTGPAGWLIAAGVAFVAFRVFDVIKPPPARQLERLPRGWGVLLDDIAAGVYANLAAQGVLRWLLPL
ncbi:MAG: phosphatidylglycerophosphatase A, partial [Planctomycetaceae bacterium]|nr:phosphatidylglycerophosphatase A [Planctomycetaceae bacterium]